MLNQNKESQKINIEINGKNYKAFLNQSIIEVADANNIYIPRFCYHKKLSISANCRMCLVDIKGIKRASPACATKVTEGMKINTCSNKVLQIQKNIMEFILINHPLDCPICDQGGECELQDIAIKYSNIKSKYFESKRIIENPNLGPLIAADMTRCILCTRCVRFGEEISNSKELGIIGKGDSSAISAYISNTMINSELSGNIIDLCPVGALTSKPFRFKARSWELKEFPTLSASDGLATEINAHIYQNKLIRITSRESKITGIWISDKDRFEYTGLYSKDRIKQPIIKKNNKWFSISWREALQYIKTNIYNIKKKYGGNSISAIISENASSEEMYLIKKLLLYLDSKNIDSRIQQYADISGISSGKGFSCSLTDIVNSDFIIIFGSNIRKEYPLINIAIKEAVEKNKAKVFACNIYYYNFNYNVEQVTLSFNNIEYIAISLLKAIFINKNLNDINFNKIFKKIKILKTVQYVANKVLTATAPKIIIGQDIINSKYFKNIFSILNILEKISNLKGGLLASNVNSVGANKILYFPKNEFNTYNCLNGKTNTKLLLTVHTELDQDSIYEKQKIIDSLKNIETIICFTSFINKFTTRIADIILPIAIHYETSGSFIDLFGNKKEFKQVVKPYENNKELWKILRELGNLLKTKLFKYKYITEITNDIYKEINNINDINDYIEIILNSKFSYKKEVGYIKLNSIYNTTSMLRRANPLQKTNDAKFFNNAKISKKIANKIGLKNKSGIIKIYNTDQEINLKVIVDPNLHSKNIMIPKNIFKEFLNHNNINIKLFIRE